MNEIGYKTKSWIVPLARDCDINFMDVPFSQEYQKELRKVVGKSSYLQQDMCMIIKGQMLKQNSITKHKIIERMNCA